MNTTQRTFLAGLAALGLVLAGAILRGQTEYWRQPTTEIRVTDRMLECYEVVLAVQMLAGGRNLDQRLPFGISMPVWGYFEWDVYGDCLYGTVSGDYNLDVDLHLRAEMSDWR